MTEEQIVCMSKHTITPIVNGPLFIRTGVGFMRNPGLVIEGFVLKLEPKHHTYAWEVDDFLPSDLDELL